MTTAAIIALGSLITLTGWQYGKSKGLQGHELRNAYDNYQNAIKNNNLSSLDTKDLIEQLWTGGYLSTSEYKNALNSLDSLEHIAKDKTDAATVFNTAFTSKDTFNAATNLYNLIAQKAPLLDASTRGSYTDLVNAATNSFYEGLPEISNAPTPGYLDTNFQGEQLQVTDPKLWTGQELADLHNINYDTNHYYDLIKQGTQANLKLGEFTNAQLDALTNSTTTTEANDYLNSIRNSKSEAINNGITSGARAASEVLANANAVAARAQTYADAANTKADNMKNLIEADAKANLAAREYFDSIARSLSTDSANLYYSDVDRYGQEILSNAELYTADQNLRGARLEANADMYANMLTANSQINNVRNSVNAESDELAWLFNNALTARPNLSERERINAAYNAVNDYIFRTYNNGTNRFDYIKNALNNQ